MEYYIKYKSELIQSIKYNGEYMLFIEFKWRTINQSYTIFSNDDRTHSICIWYDSLEDALSKIQELDMEKIVYNELKNKFINDKNMSIRNDKNKSILNNINKYLNKKWKEINVDIDVN